MGSNQSTTKRDNEVDSLQNQNADNTISSGKGAVASTKGFEEQLNPLLIGTILENIFSNLDVESIKNARQVHPLWSVEGAKMLIAKCYIQLPNNLQTYKLLGRTQEIDEFKAFLSHKLRDDSMIRNITLNDIGDVALWKFLGVLGRQVKCVKVNHPISENDWLPNLLDLLPNLQHLKFAETTTLSFVANNEFVIKVLTCAMSAAKKDRCPLVISFMALEVQNIEQLENLEKFADCTNIMIEELAIVLHQINNDVPSLRIRINKLMGKILSTSQNVLKKLTLLHCQLIIPLIEFPRMNSLTNIELNFCSETVNQLQPCKFSPSFRFSEKLPNLSHVSIFHTNNENLPLSNDFFTHVFEQTGTAPSVKSLKYTDNFADFDTAPIFRTFPNIEEFQTVDVVVSQRMLCALWKHGTSLKKLDIKVCLDHYIASGADLDSSFTGFSPETVDKIRKAPNLAPCTLEELEKFRVNPSILNLKDLEHLTIRLKGSSQPHLRIKRILAVAAKYAFGLMPNNLKIFVHVGERSSPLKCADDALDEISKLQNVTVVLNGGEDDIQSITVIAMQLR